jgi:PKD repeat protein
VFTRAGTYEATVTATDPRGGTGTAKVTVVVGNPRGNQAPAVQIAANPRRGTAPLRVSFGAAATDPDGDSMLYLWDFGDGGKAGGRTATHLYRQPGTYTAKITVDDLKGGRTTAEVTITVTARPAMQVLGMSEATGSMSLRTFSSSGLKAVVTCADTASGKATMSVSKALARKLGLRSATLASASVKCRSGKRANVRVKPSRAVIRRLQASGQKSVKATLGVTVKGRSVARQSVTIRR